MASKYPELVVKLTTICDAWIVGSSAKKENKESNFNFNNDYDVYVPITKWSEACAMIPKDAKINRLGGFKCLSEGIEVDVWTGEMCNFLSSSYFTVAYHPKTDVRIIREK